MQNQHPTRLLFPTSFSDACFKTIPALSEWMDDPNMHLTILHVYDPKKKKRAQVENQLYSFFAEADQYGRCERILVSGPAEESITQHCKQVPYDLVFVPASEPTGFPRIGHKSLRATLLQNGISPLWTSEDQLNGNPLRRRPNSVAYVMSNEENWQDQLTTAAHTAARWNVPFHLIYLIPPPSMGDGTLASDIFVQDPDGPLVELQHLGTKLPVPIRVRTSTGNDQIEFPRMIKDCGADLIFIGSNLSVSRGLFGTSVNPIMRSIPGQFICFPKGYGKLNTQEYIRMVDQWEPLQSH